MAEVRNHTNTYSVEDVMFYSFCGLSTCTLYNITVYTHIGT